MDPKQRRLGIMLLFSLLLVGCCTFHAFAQTANLTIRQKVTARGGIVVLGYAPKTTAELLDTNNHVVWHGTLYNTRVEPIPLKDGNYTLCTDDDVKIVSTNRLLYQTSLGKDMLTGLGAFLQKRAAQAKAAGPQALLRGMQASQRPSANGIKHYDSTGSTSPVFNVLPIPAVQDVTFANNPPSFASSHVIFQDVPTRLKAVIVNGVGPYQVQWNPGDGSGLQPAFSTSDPRNGAAFTYTYTGSVLLGEQFAATVTVKDISTGLTVQGQYWLRVGDPTKQADRISRATDEGLWYVHTQLQRTSYTYTSSGNPVTVPEAFFEQGSGYTFHSTSLAAIDLENTGHSITGGYNFSHDPTVDPYVEDLNEEINWLTDPSNLGAVNISGVARTFEGLGTFTIDTHGPGGVPNGIALLPSGYNNEQSYEGGAMLQAIADAGNVAGAVPNRPEYPRYYDLIGDFVDGFQYYQGYNGGDEGGWRYSTSYLNDSDGSTAAWVCIGLRAAQNANKLTPGAPLPPIQLGSVQPITLNGVNTQGSWVVPALNIWLNSDQYGFGLGNYVVDAYNQTRGANQYFNQYGGFDYEPSFQYQNAGKTGGGLVGIALSLGTDINGYPVTTPSPLIPDARANAAIGFLYRNFFNYDYNFGWSSARDSYGMYNMLKGLNEFGVSTLTDPNSPDGSHDLDGFPLAPFNWFSTLSDFIAGTSAVDLGHQDWNHNLPSTDHNDGSFESTGYKAGDLWSYGYSDGDGGSNLVTVWDIAVLQSAVFVPPPVPIIYHPNALAGENYVPTQFNNKPYEVIFDPATSYDLNPQASIIHAHWDFGDGGSDDYDLPYPSPPGGQLPIKPGLHPTGNQTEHNYTNTGTYTATLTLTDNKGASNSATVVMHVVPAPFPPTSVLNITALGSSRQNGDTVGVLPNGTVTLQIDGSSSYNLSPPSVSAPTNANGISSFAFSWPTLLAQGTTGGSVTSDPISMTGPFNSGALEPNFLEGATDTSGTLTPGSKAATQSFTFQFNPNNIPSAITIGLTVTSNIIQVGGEPPNTNTIFQQINLLPNNQVNPGNVQITRLYVSNITSTSAIVHFKTVAADGIPSSTTAAVNFGLTSAYGSSASDGLLATDHAITLTGLTQNTTYNFIANAADTFNNTAQTANGTFKTLPQGNPDLMFAISGHSASNGVETATYTVTNIGGQALGFYTPANTYVATNGVTYSSTTAPTTAATGATIAAGGTYQFSVQWHLPASPPTLFQSKLTAIYKNSVNFQYSTTVNKTIAVP